MNLDDLMEVWRSQDASPLHGVNETLLRLALRQDEAKLQKRRRWARWFTYFVIALIVAVMALLLVDHDPPPTTTMCCPVGTTPSRSSAWPPPCSVRHDVCGLPGAGAREQRFGDSLRDQINRQIAQIDPFMISPWATRAARAKSAPIFMLGLVLIAAIGFMSGRINEHKPYTRPGVRPSA